MPYTERAPWNFKSWQCLSSRSFCLSLASLPHFHYMLYALLVWGRGPS